MRELKGVIPAVTTPFREDRSLDLGAFERLVELVIGDGVDGIVVTGCTGECWAVEDDERAQLFAAAVRVAKGRVPIVAGCGGMLPSEAIARVRQAERAGCDVAMVQPPWYVMPGEDEVRHFYEQVLAATDLPVMLYNIPRRTGIHLSLDLVDRLADHPRVVAIKESSKDWLTLSAIIRKTRGRIGVFAGYASAVGLAAIAEGAVGYVDSTTPVVGRLSPDFYRAAQSGDRATARRLEAAMADLKFFGCGTFPASVKAALDLIGRPGGWPRDPIRPLTPPERERLSAMLRKAGLLGEPARRVAG